MSSPTFPTETDLGVIQGEVFTVSATWTVGGQPKPLTGYVAHLQVRRRRGSFGAVPLIELWSDGTDPAITLEPGGQVGVVKVRISGTLTAQLRRNAWYDLWVVKADDPGEAVRLAYGQIVVSTSATDNSAVATREMP